MSVRKATCSCADTADWEDDEAASYAVQPQDLLQHLHTSGLDEHSEAWTSLLTQQTECIADGTEEQQAHGPLAQQVHAIGLVSSFSCFLLEDNGVHAAAITRSAGEVGSSSQQQFAIVSGCNVSCGCLQDPSNMTTATIDSLITDLTAEDAQPPANSSDVVAWIQESLRNESLDVVKTMLTDPHCPPALYRLAIEAKKLDPSQARSMLR